MADIANNTMMWPAKGLDLAATLFCGQTFSWAQDGDGFAGVAGHRAARVWQRGDVLYVQVLGAPAPDDEAFWRHYFALDEDYGVWTAQFARHPVLRQCVESCPGIRVLNQPLFDTLLSFIISQNNNIPRITGIVQRLRTEFGPQLAPGVRGFPAPERLAGLAVEDLAGLRAGFRAKYLLDAAGRVAEGRLREDELRARPTDEARGMLMQVYGVGQKVADCVLLFGLSRKEVAPMDVWMRRAVQRYFDGQLPACAAGGQGIAQQYIFHWMRHKGQDDEK